MGSVDIGEVNSCTNKFFIMRKLVITIFLISISKYSYSQLWKQYADSAKVNSDQKNSGKALELYIKVREELKKDSVFLILLLLFFLLPNKTILLFHIGSFFYKQARD